MQDVASPSHAITQPALLWQSTVHDAFSLHETLHAAPPLHVTLHVSPDLQPYDGHAHAPHDAGQSNVQLVPAHDGH